VAEIVCEEPWLALAALRSIRARRYARRRRKAKLLEAASAAHTYDNDVEQMSLCDIKL